MDAHRQATVSASFRCCRGWTEDHRSCGIEVDPASRTWAEALKLVVGHSRNNSAGEDGGSMSTEAEHAAVEDHGEREAEEEGDTEGGNCSSMRDTGWR